MSDKIPMRLILSIILLSLISCSKDESLFNLNKIAIEDGSDTSPAPTTPIAPATAFITTWEVTAGNLTVNLPINANFNYNFTILWGDEDLNDPSFVPQTFIHNSTNPATFPLSHTYASPGVYTITMEGVFEYFGNYGCPAPMSQLRSVEQWGTNVWRSLSESFCYTSNFQINASDAPDLSLVTDMKHLFNLSYEFDSPIGHWDVSNVEDFSYVFGQNLLFNHPLTNWNPINATTLSDMFYSAESFNQPLAHWNLPRVTDIDGMFMDAKSITQDYSCWNMPIVSAPSWTFDYNANPLMLRPVYSGAPSASCIVPAAESAINLASHPGAFISTWKIFRINDSITLPIGLRVGETLTINWGEATSVDEVITNTSQLTKVYANPGYYHIIVKGQFDWIGNTTYHYELSRMTDIKQWGNNVWGDLHMAFTRATDLKISATDAPDLSNTTTTYEMFAYNYNLKGNLSHWDVSNITNMRGMFDRARHFSSDLSGWDVCAVTNRVMFDSQSQLTAEQLPKWTGTPGSPCPE